MQLLFGLVIRMDYIFLFMTAWKILWHPLKIMSPSCTINSVPLAYQKKFRLSLGLEGHTFSPFLPA